MTKRFLKFLAPDGVEGGGNDGGVATIERKPGSHGAEGLPDLEPAGNIFTRELASLRKKPTQEEFDASEGRVAETKEEETVVKEEAPVVKDVKKPSSALDAALDEDAVEKVEAGAQDEDYLADVPEKLTKGKQAEDWSKARGKIEKMSSIIKEERRLRAEIEAKAKDANAPSAEVIAENDRLKKENAEYKDSMVALNIEFEPEHRKKFVEGRQILVDKATAKFEAFAGVGKGEPLAKALAMPESRQRTVAINEALSELDDDGEKHRVRDFISQIDRLDDEKAEIQKNPQQAWEKLKATDTEKKKQAEAEAANYKQRIYDETKAKISKTLLLARPVDKELDGAKEHNERVDQITQEAWRLLGNITPQEAAESAFRAASATHYQTLLVNTRKELREAIGRIAEYEGAEPGFRNGTPPAKSDHEAKLEKTPGQLYAESLRQQRGD